MPDASEFSHGQLPGSLELAFVGDSVYDLYVREHVTRRGGHVKELSRRATGYVNAHAQSESLKKILPLLTEEEAGIIRRAHNAKQTPTGHADPKEYKNATALEALIGYLYLTHNVQRLDELLGLATGLAAVMEAADVSGK